MATKEFGEAAVAAILQRMDEKAAELLADFDEGVVIRQSRDLTIQSKL